MAAQLQDGARHVHRDRDSDNGWRLRFFQSIFSCRSYGSALTGLPSRCQLATPAVGGRLKIGDCVLFAERLEAHRHAVEKRLRHLLGDVRDAPLAPVRLAEAMRYATLGGGKRFRPFLVIEAAALFGVSEQHALDTAAAI